MTNSGRLVFLDVGGHLGQTLDEVLRPEYEFDLVHCFEPLPDFAARLEQKFAPHVAQGKLIVHPFGLSDRATQVTLYGDNLNGGASIFASKSDDEDKSIRTVIQLQSASEFFRTNLQPGDCIIMKLNCEGSECAILRDLAATGEIFKITNAMIDFDMFKVRGKRHEPFQVLKLLKSIDFDRYFLAGSVMVGKSHERRIRNWLSHVHHEIPLSHAEGFLLQTPLRPKFLKNFVRGVRSRVLAAIGQ